jgi:DNA-binding PadR family transcriptional regulator
VPRNVQAAKTALGAFGRFSEPALLVLASLAASPKHGYAIIQDVEEHAGQRLGPGTLYGAISRLERLEFIKPLEMQERGRRPYRITAAGRRAFFERLHELREYHSLLRGLAAE